ncbi:MAG: hypothetical protein IH798_05810 [Gemmatimonadetes bacterium]|nr:hypothetical protein [Gemmatimonadota bacterium]
MIDEAGATTLRRFFGVQQVRAKQRYISRLLQPSITFTNHHRVGTGEFLIPVGALIDHSGVINMPGELKSGRTFHPHEWP